MASLQTLEVEHARLRERHEENPSGRLFAPLADVLRKLGRLDEALELCSEGLSRHPAYSSAYVILGKIHLERGENDQARDSFEKVLEIDAENLLALRHLAKMHEASGDLAAAEQLWVHVESLEPDSKAVETRLEALRRRRQGREDTEQGQESAPENSDEVEAPAESADDVTVDDAPSQEGPDAAPDVGEPAAAQEQVEAPAQAQASSAEIATITLAQIYYEQGFLRKALEVYEQVQDRNPQLEGIDEQLGRLRREIEEAKSAPAPAEAELDELVVDDPARVSEPVSAPAGASEEELIREGPITRKGQGRSELERFDGFRRWLDGISDDEDSDSE